MKKILFTSLLACLFNFANAQTIAEIQGTTDASPFAGMEVTTSGIVTATAAQGYYIQDGTDIRSGIYVYDQTYTPQVGDEISLTGIVEEYFTLTELKDISAQTVLSSNNPLPSTIVLTTLGINDEDYEGMLVQVEAATCSNVDAGFGEWELNDGSGICRVDDLMFLFSPSLNVDYTVTGVLHFSFDFYKIEPRSSDDIQIALPLFFTKTPKETAINNNSLTVYWETNIPANTKIAYGLTPNLELGILEDNTMSTTHEMTIDNLTPATIYYVKPFSEAGTDTTPSQNLVMCTRSNSSGEINVYFNHNVDHSVSTNELAVTTNHVIDTIIDYINQAEYTLDITMYEAEDQSIVNAINAADERGVQVRVISDDEGTNEVYDNLNANIAYLEGNPDGIMHNKFFIIDVDHEDQAWVLSGSTNHTHANLGWDYNNVITIQDQSLARAYTLEFNEMWGSDGAQFDINNSKFGSDKTNNTPHHFIINDIPIELYFSPTDGTAQRIKKAIDDAEDELAFAILVFTENSLGTAVKDAYDRGVDVKGIIDYVEFNGSEFDWLVSNNVDVIDYQNADGSQWPDGPTLHHKYAIIDYSTGGTTPLLITGTHNWSASANSVHDENTLLIYDHTIANIYYQEFSARFQGLVATEDKKIESLDISPNPFVESLLLEIPEDGILEITDLSGRIFQKEKVTSGQHILNTENWQSGMYFIYFEGKNFRKIGKVTK